MALKPIQILINAKDDASAVFDRLQTRIAAFAAVVLGYLGFQAFAGWIKGGADLEQALSRVQAATNATVQEMAALRKATLDAANDKRFNFTQLEAAGALENLAKAGLSVKDAIATLPAAMQLARAGDIELAASAEYLTKIVTGLGLSFSESGRVADVLAKGANATNTSVTGLAQALSYAAPLANTLGLGLETTVAIIGKFADAGIDASRAGTALNSILAQFSDPASKFRTELAAAGITTVNFEQALHELAAAGPRGQRAIAAVGQEAGPALRALLNQGVGKLDELKKALQDASGSAADTAAVMQNNLNGALAGLRTAWDTVVNALTTPVLPVLKQGVDQLTGALRTAVADGTIGKFGNALASAFQGAIKWASGFLASVDFAQLTAKVQAFADRASEVLDSFAQKAQTTASIAQTAWGVIVAGLGTLQAAMFKIAEGMANMVSGVLGGVATIIDGLSKITFGDLSAAFKAAAEEVRLSAEATGAVADAFGVKAGEAFDRAAEGAQAARDGFAGLIDGATASSTAAAATKAAFTDMAASLAAAGESAQVAGQKAAGAGEAQKAAAATARAEVERLRAEYAKAIETGNLQLAAEKMQELTAATRAAVAAAQDNKKAQEDAALALQAAFARAGVQTKAELESLAATALRDFEMIRDSGQATANGVGEAWKRAAEAAIAAGNGVAPGWVQAQAAMRGFEVVLDSAGRATVRLRDAQNSAVQSAQELAGALRDVRTERERDLEVREKALALKEREEALERKRLGVDKSGFSTDKAGNTVNAGGNLNTLTGIAAFIKAAGISDEGEARALAKEFADAKGDIPFFGNPGQKKYGGDTLSQSLLRAVEKRTFFGQAQGATTIPQPESTRTVNLNLSLNGRDFGTVNTDAAGADRIQDLLSQIGAARGAAAPAR